ncbi:MAG: alpha/beta hydrolase [Bacteroidota bacterium]
MEKVISINGTRIWTISEGTGIPFLLCNGGPGCDDYLQAVSDLVTDICQVIRFEPRGCGRSDYDGKYDLQTTIQDIECIRQHYQCDTFIIGGHSAGPDVALAYLLQYPQHVLGLIGIAGGRIVNDREWSKTYKARREANGEDYGGKIFKADPEVNRIGNKSWRSYIHRPSLLAEIAEIQVPAIYISASEDIRPSWPTQQLAHLIPKGQYHEIKGAAHCIWLTHAEELRGLLRKAVAQILSS